MIILVDNKSVGYEFNFGAKEGDVIQDLINLFVEKHGLNYYNKASVVIVRNEVYFFIIKNIFGDLRGNLIFSEISPIINKTLSL